MTDLKTYEFSKAEDAAIITSVFIGSLVIAYLMYRNLLFAAVGMLMLPRVREMIRQTLIDNRRRRYMNEFRDFLFMASTAIGAGRSMKDAIGESIRPLEKIHGTGSVLAHELSVVYERMETGSENDVAVLMDLAAHSGMEDVYDFVTIYSICKTTGASMIIALGRAASVIIDKMTIEKEVDELVRRKKSEGLIIFLMPVGVILFLNLCAPDYIAPLYESLAGRLIMTGIVVSAVGVYSMIQKIVRIDI